MSNRTIIILTFVVLAGMAILFILNIQTALTGQTGLQTYVKYNNVRGIAVKQNQLLYTLNFSQQNELIRLLNQSIPVKEIPGGQREPLSVQQIIIYQFEGKPDIILTPIAYVSDDLVFSAPGWSASGYLLDISHGQLKNLLLQTYDR